MAFVLRNSIKVPKKKKPKFLHVAMGFAVSPIHGCLEYVKKSRKAIYGWIIQEKSPDFWKQVTEFLPTLQFVPRICFVHMFMSLVDVTEKLVD